MIKEKGLGKKLAEFVSEGVSSMKNFKEYISTDPKVYALIGASLATGYGCVANNHPQMNGNENYSEKSEIIGTDTLSVNGEGIQYQTEGVDTLETLSESYSDSLREESAEPEKKGNSNIIYSTRPELSAAGSGVFLKNYSHNIELAPGEKISLYERFGLEAKIGKVLYEVVELDEGLDNIKSYFEGIREDTDSESVKRLKKSMINYIESLQNEFSQEDSSSTAKLEEMVQRGYIEGGEIKEGTYMIIGKSQETEELNPNSVPLILYIKPREETIKESDDSLEMQDLETADEMTVATQNADSLKRDDEVIENYFADVDTLTNKDLEHVDKRDRPVGLIVDAFHGQNGLFGAGVGVNYGRFNLILNYSEKNNQLVNELEVPLSRGRQGIGTEREIDFNSIGAALEVQLGPLFGGAGINNWNYSREVKEEILSGNGDVLKSDIISKSASELSKRFYGGLNIPVSGGLDLRLLGGHDSKSDWFGGAGIKVNLNKKTHRKQNR